MPLVEIRDLEIAFGQGDAALRAVDRLSLTIEHGETVAIVGESGSGKTLTALSVAKLAPSPPARYLGGEVLVNGRDVLKMPARELRSIRGRIVSYVFQEPAASLNPVVRVGTQIKEVLQLHRPDDANDSEVARLLKDVGIPDAAARARDYPHQLSGGMQQRVMIAMAIASHPKLLVADEPTTALDVTIQAEILQLLRDLKARLGMSILLITHNLALVAEIADRVAVMYAGQIVESAPAAALLARPLHPYTRALIQAIPKLGTTTERLMAIPGTVPRGGVLPTGCRFHPRCDQARPECSVMTPELIEVEPRRWVRCPFWESNHAGGGTT